MLLASLACWDASSRNLPSVRGKSPNPHLICINRVIVLLPEPHGAATSNMGWVSGGYAGGAAWRAMQCPHDKRHVLERIYAPQ